jgi:hypothetical protein
MKADARSNDLTELVARSSGSEQDIPFYSTTLAHESITCRHNLQPVFVLAIASLGLNLWLARGPSEDDHRGGIETGPFELPFLSMR